MVLGLETLLKPRSIDVKVQMCGYKMCVHHFLCCPKLYYIRQLKEFFDKKYFHYLPRFEIIDPGKNILGFGSRHTANNRPGNACAHNSARTGRRQRCDVNERRLRGTRSTQRVHEKQYRASISYHVDTRCSGHFCSSNSLCGLAPA